MPLEYASILLGALAILLGFAYLVATRTIQATIPVTIVATVFVLTALNTGSAYTALIECMSAVLRRVYRPHHLPHPPLRLDE